MSYGSTSIAALSHTFALRSIFEERVLRMKRDRELTSCRRIRALKRGEDPNERPQSRSVPLRELQSDPPNTSEPPFARHVATIHDDPIKHPVTSLSAIIANATLPNKYRVQARVRSVHSRGLAGNSSLVQYHCVKCSQQ